MERREIAQRIRLNELERIPRLRLYVHSDDLESSARVSHRRSACSAEQIE
jgi:hypothetical protein